ncbi:MAG: ABC transporter substrate-binding protein [Beijerinckiaceae bacterium]|nr:ABC transporter substrate-binding protein [Beijerinckiaceae bacterium]
MEIAETLVRADDSGQLLPALASHFHVDSDYMTWRFKLREQAIFHDGSAVTPQAIVQELERIRLRPAAALSRVPIASIRAEGDSIVIALTRPFALLPAYLAAGSSIILSPGSYGSNGALGAIFGSGPYRLASIKDANNLEMRAVDDPSDHAIRTVHYMAVNDAETRARMLEAGNAHLIYNLSPAARERLRRNPAIRVVSTAGPRIRYVMVNTSDPRLADINVRRALSLAMDRINAARILLRSPNVAASQMMPPILPDWTLPGGQMLMHDEEQANSLLEKAGWKREKGGVRQKDGKRLSFTLNTYSMRPELPSLAEALQAQWKKVGVEVRISLVTPDRILSDSRSGALELALIARSYFVVPDLVGTLSEDFDSASPARGWGAVGWSSSEVNDALRRYENSTDESVRETSRKVILRIIHEELPILPHSWFESVLAHSAALTNVSNNPFETSFSISRMRWAS